MFTEFNGTKGYVDKDTDFWSRVLGSEYIWHGMWNTVEDKIVRLERGHEPV